MSKWLTVLIVLSLAKIGRFTTPVAVVPAPVAVVPTPVAVVPALVEPVITAYDIMEKIKTEGEDVISSMMDHVDYIVDNNTYRTHKTWLASVKEPGKDNELWMNYYLMNWAVMKGKFAKAGKLLDVIVTSPNNGAVLKAIKGGANKEYRSVLELIYELKSYKTITGNDFEDFKSKLIEHVYTGADRENYDKIQDAMSRTQFTDEEFKLALNGLHVDRLKIMIKQLKKSNLSKNDLNATFYRLGFYLKWNPSLLKMLIKENVPMIPRNATYSRHNNYNQSDQKLRAANLDLIKLHDFGDDLKNMNEMIPDFDDISIGIAIKDDKLNKNLSLFFMNRQVGLYKSEWIITAIKHANMDVLKVLLEERVPLPTAQELSNAIANRKETTKTIQEYNTFIDSYRQFYDPVTRLCKEGPKLCKQRVEEDYTWRNGEPVKIEIEIKEFKFKTYHNSGNLTYSSSYKSECQPFVADYGGAAI